MKSIKTVGAILLTAAAVSFAQLPEISNGSTLYTFEQLSRLAKSGLYFKILNDTSGQHFISDCTPCPVITAGGKRECFLTWQYGLEIFRSEIDRRDCFSRHVKSVSEKDMWVGGRKTLHRNFDRYRIEDDFEVGYIGNIYVKSSALWIGFVHIERSNFSLKRADVPNRNYAIGIASSENQGRSWKYHGDVIRAQADTVCPPDDRHQNLGGVPYIVVQDDGDDWFYVYFNEYAFSLDTYGYPAVARARVEDVLHLVRNYTEIRNPMAIGTPGNRYEWKKYNTSVDGTWSENGLTGVGERLMTDILVPPVANGIDYYNVNLHGDAAYVEKSGVYLLVPSYRRVNITTIKECGVKVLQSKDGIHWQDIKTVDSDLSGRYWYHHTSIMPVDTLGNRDGSSVFDRCCITYSRFEHRYGNMAIWHPVVRMAEVIYP